MYNILKEGVYNNSEKKYKIYKKINHHSLLYGQVCATIYDCMRLNRHKCDASRYGTACERKRGLTAWQTNVHMKGRTSVSQNRES